MEMARRIKNITRTKQNVRCVNSLVTARGGKMCGTLELALVSPNGVGIEKKAIVYAVTSITNTLGKVIQMFKIPLDEPGTWNVPIKLTVSELDGENQKLVVKIKAIRKWVDKNLGRVRVPIKDLLEGVTPQGKSVESVSYQLSPKRKGVLSFLNSFGEIIRVPMVSSKKTSSGCCGGGCDSSCGGGCGCGCGCGCDGC